MTKILQVVAAFHRNRNYGGPVVYAEALAESLKRDGAEVRVVSSQVGEGDRYSSVEQAGNGITVLYLGHVWRYRWCTLDISGMRMALRWVRESDVVIVHSYRTFTSALISIWARINRKRVWFFPHGSVKRRFRSIPSKLVFDFVIGQVLRFCYDAVMVLSELEKKEVGTSLFGSAKLKKMPPIQVKQPQAGMRGPWRAKYGIEPGDLMILFVGRLIRIKNLARLLEAFEVARKPHWKLIIIGPQEDAGYFKELQAVVSRNGLQEAVSFAGPYFGDEKLAAITDADVCVLPSEYESFGQFALEALQLRIPLVISDQCGAAHDLQSPNMFVVPPTAEGIAGGLLKAEAAAAVGEVYGPPGVSAEQKSEEEFDLAVRGVLHELTAGVTQ